MKTKFHSFTKLMFKSLMSALIFVSFVLLGGVVLLARTSNSTALSSLKAEVNDNKLSATNRNALLDYIAKMDVELQALSNGSSSATSVDVPAGAVMAFDLSTCPNGWTRFSAADNRFIMGATSNSKETGGSGSVMLQANQMAPHSHWFADSFFSEAFTYAQHSTTPAVGFRAGIDTVSGKGWYGTKADADYDNYLSVVWRKTGSKIVNGSENVKSDTPGNITEGAKAYDWQSGMPDYSTLGVQQSVNIQNPYIKLIYCKKN